MSTEELLTHLIDNVPNFENPAILGPGRAYHYTTNWEALDSSAKFRGAPIDENLDKTQSTLNSLPARSDPGVVFAYENLHDAKDEGFGCDIVEINYRSAIKTMHGQENALGQFTAETLKDLGQDFVNMTPHTLLILNTEILDFQIVK